MLIAISSTIICSRLDILPPSGVPG